MGTEAAPQGMPPKAEPQKEHQWLHKLVGEWTYEPQITAPQPGDQGCEMANGTESVRSIGGLWIQGEGRGAMPGGEAATTLVTLGYDPLKKRFVGSWVGSMMTCLWVYEGDLDADETTLSLYAEGPAFVGTGTAKYKDVVAFQDDDHRTLTSYVQGENGEWTQFMTMRYSRVHQIK